MPKWLLMVLALTLLVALASPILADETKGKIKSVSADKKEFVMTDNNGKDWTFQLAEDGKVRLANQDGKLSDLKDGDEVTITYEKKDDKFIASKVERK
jgi:hypothetical protein